MKKKIFKRRHLLLLEVIIAIAIILLCIFPLIYPHAMMAKVQKEFIQKIELDHAVTLLFGQVYQDLLSNRIEWADIENQRKFEVRPEDLQKYGYDKVFPYEGYYRFEKTKWKKPKNSKPDEATAYIYNLIFSFVPLYKSKNSEQKPLEYKYEIFILRDLRTEKTSKAKVENTDNPQSGTTDG